MVDCLSVFNIPDVVEMSKLELLFCFSELTTVSGALEVIYEDKEDARDGFQLRGKEQAPCEEELPARFPPARFVWLRARSDGRRSRFMATDNPSMLG